MLLNLNNIQKKFGGNKVINELSLQLEKGRFYTILGTNGAGKTTLLNLINGQIKCDEGQILFDDKDIRSPLHKRQNCLT